MESAGEPHDILGLQKWKFMGLSQSRFQVVKFSAMGSCQEVPKGQSWKPKERAKEKHKTTSSLPWQDPWKVQAEEEAWKGTIKEGQKSHCSNWWLPLSLLPDSYASTSECKHHFHHGEGMFAMEIIKSLHHSFYKLPTLIALTIKTRLSVDWKVVCFGD